MSFPSFLLGFCDGGLGGEWLADYGLMQVDLLRADARERGFPDRDAGGGYQPCHTRGERAEEGQGAILCLSAIHTCQIHVESRLDRHWTGTGDILWRCYSGAPSVASEKAIEKGAGRSAVFQAGSQSRKAGKEGVCDTSTKASFNLSVSQHILYIYLASSSSCPPTLHTFCEMTPVYQSCTTSSQQLKTRSALTRASRHIL